ncbi:hypothetical protein CPB84DRAFT_163056 [Gymnopilus junonius]|uniref:Uncharacterized protein n=1 Tax=Gymnopilus junonius TaxID=109634 RepID=A0A9P5NXC0_GYMJU|nr:hypothetical protein CPB84DRAFT_163056 [Gymnopilus junonius]
MSQAQGLYSGTGRGQQMRGKEYGPGGMHYMSPNAKAPGRIDTNQHNTTSSSAGGMFSEASDITVSGGQFQAANNLHHYHISIGPSPLNHSEGPPSRTHSNEDSTHASSEPRTLPHPFAGKTEADQNFRPSAKKTSDIYYQHIGVQRRGSPLWIPEPNENLSIEYRRTGITIGDVGIITEFGAFDFLFNICHPRNHPINPPNLPADFATLNISPMDIHRYTEFGSGSYLSSSTIRKSEQTRGVSGLTFKTDASEGALLTMPVGSQSEDVVNIRHVRQFIAQHAEAWYMYALGVRGREAKNGDLRVVIGYDKTTAWGMATFSDATSQEGPCLLRFLSTEDSRSGTPYQTYFWEYSGTAQVRSGPDTSQVERLRGSDPSQEGISYQNQTLFVRTMNITLQQHLWKKLPIEAKEVTPIDRFNPHFRQSHGLKNLFPGNQYQHPFIPEDNTPVLESARFNALDVHPSKGINEKLLKVSFKILDITRGNSFIEGQPKRKDGNN